MTAKTSLKAMAADPSDSQVKKTDLWKVDPRRLIDKARPPGKKPHQFQIQSVNPGPDLRHGRTAFRFPHLQDPPQITPLTKPAGSQRKAHFLLT